MFVGWKKSLQFYLNTRFALFDSAPHPPFALFCNNAAVLTIRATPAFCCRVF
ncbi:hypothetical protein HMPREF9120_01801 [Neisseria sp. oral taxon 020 str. F0370]|nr:hypothetical protein HMPREF9120_01801 [Neisseria sp. oral taxon 020 str. F0370]